MRRKAASRSSPPENVDMDKKTAALLGAAAAAITAGSAQANTLPSANASPIPQASSYAELLAPIPNALSLLQADDAARAQTKADEVKLAETVIIRRGHRHYHHHHHHHHHHRTVIGIPGVGGVSIGRGHHHHHHHHHSHYDR
ncbi:hypothetical protein [Bradyrhizobium oligotrophicum]|nr:hypothetical protein [Bradyrhizobium oligotrophicum]